MKAINGKLSVIDGNRVYWNGTEVIGVESIILVGNKSGANTVTLKIKDGNPDQIIALAAGGINVRGAA